MEGPSFTDQQAAALRALLDLTPEDREAVVRAMCAAEQSAKDVIPVAAASHSKNLLSFPELTGLDLATRESLLITTRADAGEYLIAWGSQPERKRSGTPVNIYEIRHAFGSEQDPHDTCLVGRWFIWPRNGEQPMAELYMLPNRAINAGDLIQMIKSVAPEWFLEPIIMIDVREPDEGCDPGPGVRAPVSIPPDGGQPGLCQPLPVDSRAVDVQAEGVVPSFATV